MLVDVSEQLGPSRLVGGFSVRIGEAVIGLGRPTFIIAEMSANHGHDFERAVQIIKAAKDAGADAVKLQTYTPDTITLRSSSESFRVAGGTLWDGRTLYELYEEAYTPWDWHPRLKEVADELGIMLFSTPFDVSAVEFLESLGVPAYKIASAELVDVPLLRKVARTGKPLIISTGMATLAEIAEAVETVRTAGAVDIALLRTNSAYPAPVDEMDLRTIPHLSEAFGVPVGLSDHTLEIAVPVAAVALGAAIIEKHLTLSRDLGGPDSAFSLEPDEFKAMVQAVRTTEKALGGIRYGPTPCEVSGLPFRRSLFVVKDIKAGESFTHDNVRSIRPAHGLHPRYLDSVIGRKATQDLVAGTPLKWEHVG